ncbi:hypothetical protein ACIF6L_36745 [Kitasatospora sp. NPDC086009]|uniref:hypothetical protein n=1 Tax=unclassified Kitasatospora TaxID=2633591 RepID=UPI0037C81F44
MAAHQWSHRWGPWAEQWQDWLRRSPVGVDLLVWWRDEGGDLLALVGPQRYLQRLAELLSRASPRDVAALGIGCTRRIDRPCRDPGTCGQDRADDDPTAAPRHRTGPVPGACSGFKDCWSAYGIDVEFTADDRHRAVHLRDPSDHSRTDVWVDGVRVADGITLDSSGYWVDGRYYVVQAEGPQDHPEQSHTMGHLCCTVLSLVVHDAELATTRILVPRATEAWTDPELGRDGDTLCVYPSRGARAAGRADRVLPVEPLPPSPSR